MAIKKSELYSSLWAGCDELRGGMVRLKGQSDIGDKINTQIIQPLIDNNSRLTRSDFPDFNDPNKLAEPYDMPLPQFAASVAELEAKVAAHLERMGFKA